MKRLLQIVLPLVLLGGLLLLLGLRELDRPTERSLREDGLVRVVPGASFRSVTEVLADSGWIRHPRVVAWWVALRGLDRTIHVGDYRLRRGWSPRQVIEEILAGRVEEVTLTIPEGWKQVQILDLLADSLEIERRELAEAARDTSWIKGLGIPGTTLEGYLFPETYRFPRQSDPRMVLGRMVQEANDRFDEAMRLRAAQLGMSREDVVILASIIQAEAAQEEEMSRISAVFHNRLAKGWRLEADPTVLYALARSEGPVLLRDLEVDSPYNTYRVVGLPAGAIANPGSAALRAALWPDSGRGEFYFVAKGNGEHTFSRTLDEHNRARAEVRARDGR